MTELFDCIAIGAGPAGGSTAYHLAKRGRSVLVLDKRSCNPALSSEARDGAPTATHPRSRSCAGGVSPAIAAWFDFDFAPAISRTVKTVRYTWKYDDPVVVELDTTEPMWMVWRDAFDRLLLERAIEQGATLCDGTEVTGIEFSGDRWQVNTTDEPRFARYLVAADGASSNLASWLKLDPPKVRSAAALDIIGDCPEDAPIDFAFGQVKNGFIWQFPKADGVSLATSTFIGGDHKKLGKTLAEYAQRCGFSLQDSMATDGTIALWDGDRPLHSQNALLAGETAGFVDPLTAEGIRPSLYSGVKAAEAIDRALSGDDNALANYSQTVRETWGADMAWAARLAGALYRFPGLAYKAAIKQPIATQIMLKILCGELRYSDVADRAIRKLSGGLMGR